MAITSKEDEILRQWTPLILRTLLIISATVLLIGLVTMASSTPGYYVQRFHAAQQGRGHIRQEWSQLGPAALKGDPHSILMIGLLVLTLVPLGRVAFTFVLFLREKDRIYAVATAYVLAALIAGVMLGRIG
ncbi:MAG TPA: DUF1634 domain-containing protein [Candidatus Binataceae bacterium]|nr:DUF1634 domain-containing protein [Candidatus Binataceae bacterium]